MKVLQVIDGLRSGGAEGFVTNLAIGLRDLDVEVRFYLTAGVRGERGELLHARLREAGVDVIGTEARRAASLANLRDLSRLIRSWRPDVVQANLYSAEMLCAGASLLTPVRGVHYTHRLVGTNIANYRSPWVIRRLDRFFAATIACSPAVASAYASFMGSSLRSRVVTIPNGGNLLQETPGADDRARARAALGVPEGAFAVAHVGRMSGVTDKKNGGMEADAKAHDVLIRSFARAFGDEADTILLCVGDGPLRPALEALAAAEGVADRVRFLGVLPEPWPAMTAADVFCFPSRNEGMPNVLPEAASCGLPVVASDIPENRFLDPGDPWIFAPVDDVAAFAAALRRMRDERDQFQARAHAAAAGFREQFSMRACAERYLACYREMVAGREKRHG